MKVQGEVCNVVLIRHVLLIWLLLGYDVSEATSVHTSKSLQLHTPDAYANRANS